MAGETGKFMGFGDARERRETLSAQRAGAAHVDIKPGIGGCSLDVERLGGGLERLGDRPGGRQRPRKFGRQNRTFVDGDDVVGARRCESDLQNIVGAAPRMQNRPAAAGAVRVDQVGDRCDHVRLRQGFDHQRAFP